MSAWNDYRNEIRWTIVVVVLVVLAVVALWPRDRDPQAPRPDAGAPPPAPAAEEPVDPADRAAADLAACAPSGGPRAAGLEGAVGTCLADGGPADLAAMIGGEPALINVWATWCAPCREELPALQEYAEQPDAVDVVGVQVQSGQAAGLELLTELGVHYPNVREGEQGRIRSALGASNLLPASFVVTATGEVRRVEPPIAFSSPDEVREAVRNTLGRGQ